VPYSGVFPKRIFAQKIVNHFSCQERLTGAEAEVVFVVVYFLLSRDGLFTT
jgi:hypothetical protein